MFHSTEANWCMLIAMNVQHDPWYVWILIRIISVEKQKNLIELRSSPATER